MPPTRHEWYRKGLHSRIDALDVALKGIQADHEASIRSARKVAQSLSATSLAYGFFEIHKAARRVADTPPSRLPALVQDLLAVLRQEASDVRVPQPLILIVGGDTSFQEELVTHLEMAGKQAISVATGREARRILTNREISMIVTDVFLPDQDGRDFIRDLQTRPFTAAIPVIALDALKQVTGKSGPPPPDVEVCLSKPIAAQKVADLVTSRLRRTHEAVRAAFRDQLTGLLNRAAFCDAFDQAMQTYQADKEPLAMAMIGIHRMSEFQQHHSVEVINRMLQHVGSTLSVSFRATDVVSRWDMTHFAVIFPGEDYYGGVCALEKSMSSLLRRPFLLPDGSTLILTLCAGLVVPPGRLASQDAAEQALNYLSQAEHEGGNRIRGTDSGNPGVRNKVLVFIEESNTSRVVRHLLENDHFDALVINQVDESVWAGLSEAHYHLAVIEEHIGTVSGMTILERLRALPHCVHLPVMMLTSTEDQAIRALELGANDYLVKPFAPQSFTFRLRRMMAHNTLDRPPGKAQRILVVGDEVSFLVVAGTALGKLGGFHVRLACGGEDGMTRLAAETPDAILVDFSMHKMPFTAFEKRLRAALPSGQIPTLLLAVMESEKGIAEHLESGLSIKMISKPLAPQALVQTVTTVLQGGTLPPPALADGALLNAEIQRVLGRAHSKNP